MVTSAWFYFKFVKTEKNILDVLINLDKLVKKPNAA